MKYPPLLSNSGSQHRQVNLQKHDFYCPNNSSNTQTTPLIRKSPSASASAAAPTLTTTAFTHNVRVHATAGSLYQICCLVTYIHYNSTSLMFDLKMSLVFSLKIHKRGHSERRSKHIPSQRWLQTAQCEITLYLVNNLKPKRHPAIPPTN